MICAARGPTLAEFFRGTYIPLRMVCASYKTLENYGLAVQHWHAVHPNLPVRSVDSLSLAEFQRHLSAGRSPATVNCYTRPIMAILRLAADQDHELLARLPIVQKVREPRRAPLALTVDEFRKVLAAATLPPGRDWWEAVLLTAWETGLRFRALLALRSVDLVWDSAGVFSQAEAAKDREAAWFPLQPPTLAAIRKLFDPARELLFPLDCTPGTIGKRFRRILESAGIYAPKGCGMRFHRLRRSKASYTELAGGDAQRALGHSARSVTERYLDPRIVGRINQPAMPMPAI